MSECVTDILFSLCVKVWPICAQDPPRNPTHGCIKRDQWLTSVPGSWNWKQECAFIYTQTGFSEVSCFSDLSAKNFSLESLCSALLLQLLRRGDDRKQQLCLRTVVRPLTFHPLWLAAVLEMLESAVWFYGQVFLPSLLHNMKVLF